MKNEGSGKGWKKVGRGEGKEGGLYIDILSAKYKKILIKEEYLRSQ